MEWYRVIKTIKGRLYAYEQRTWREGARVRTENRYLGPVQQAGESGSPNKLGVPVTTTRLPASPQFDERAPPKAGATPPATERHAAQPTDTNSLGGLYGAITDVGV